MSTSYEIAREKAKRRGGDSSKNEPHSVAGGEVKQKVNPGRFPKPKKKRVASTEDQILEVRRW